MERSDTIRRTQRPLNCIPFHSVGWLDLHIDFMLLPVISCAVLRSSWLVTSIMTALSLFSAQIHFMRANCETLNLPCNYSVHWTSPCYLSVPRVPYSSHGGSPARLPDPKNMNNQNQIRGKTPSGPMNRSFVPIFSANPHFWKLEYQNLFLPLDKGFLENEFSLQKALSQPSDTSHQHRKRCGYPPLEL